MNIHETCKERPHQTTDKSNAELREFEKGLLEDDKWSDLVTTQMRTNHFRVFGTYSEDVEIYKWFMNATNQHPMSKEYKEATNGL